MRNHMRLVDFTRMTMVMCLLFWVFQPPPSIQIQPTRPLHINPLHFNHSENLHLARPSNEYPSPMPSALPNTNRSLVRSLSQCLHPAPPRPVVPIHLADWSLGQLNVRRELKHLVSVASGRSRVGAIFPRYRNAFAQSSSPFFQLLLSKTTVKLATDPTEHVKC